VTSAEMTTQWDASNQEFWCVSGVSSC